MNATYGFGSGLLFNTKALISESLLIQHIVCLVQDKTLDVLSVDMTTSK